MTGQCSLKADAYAIADTQNFWRTVNFFRLSHHLPDTATKDLLRMLKQLMPEAKNVPLTIQRLNALCGLPENPLECRMIGRNSDTVVFGLYGQFYTIISRKQ